MRLEGFEPRFGAEVRREPERACSAVGRSSSTSRAPTAGWSSSPAIRGARTGTASTKETRRRSVAFVARLADEHGITLLDVMVFDQEFHWWSLHELTSGTTRWP